MGILRYRHQSSRSVSPSGKSDAWKLGVLISCIAVLLISCLLYKLWRRSRLQDDTHGTGSPNGVRHINPAELMQFCALREQRRAELEANRVVQASQLDAVAPLSVRPDRIPEKTSLSKQSNIQKPRPALLAEGLSRWRNWATGPRKQLREPVDGKTTEWADQCSICLGGFAVGDELRRTLCGHVFHGTCLERWLTEYRGRCPLCQMDLGLLGRKVSC